MKQITYYSSSVDYITEKHTAFNSAMKAAETYHEHFTIVKEEYEPFYCETCGDMHMGCALTIQVGDPGPSDLAIKLQAALQQLQKH